MAKYVLFSGSAHLQLAREMAKKLSTPLGERKISTFPNGEKRVWLKEEVAEKIVFILQPTIADSDIIELCLMADAARRKKAKKVVALTPWFGYSAQDDVFRSGEPLSAKVIAKMLEAAGIEEVAMFDPHSSKIKSFFTIPVHLLSALPLFTSLFKKKDLADYLVVTLDLGAMERSLNLAEKLNLPLVLLQKTPRNRQTGKIDYLGIEGKVKKKKVLLFDDFVSTGQTLIKAAQFLKKEGAEEVNACVTHYLPIKDLPKKLEKSQIDKFYFTNTLPISSKRRFKKLKVVSVTSILAKAVQDLLS